MRRLLSGHSFARLVAFVACILIGEIVLGLAGAVAIAWLGILDVSASAGHSAPVAWFLHFAMRHSVRTHATASPPPDFTDPVLVARGAAYFHSGCAPCHGEPGQPPSPVSRGITPPPPPLPSVAQNFRPQDLHWIVTHGIKMTAMPSWPAQRREDEVWSLVAFLEQLPALRPDTYRHLAGLDAGNVASDAHDCARCHGADGNGRGEAFPRIAGLSPEYIARSLRAFRAGTRPSGFMRMQAAALSDTEIERLAREYAALPRTASGAPADAMLIEKGRAIASPGGGRNGPACVSCHVLDAHKRNPAVPELASQSVRYLAEQLRLFRAGIRTESADARIMGRVAHRLSDDDIKAVTAYFAAQPVDASAPRHEQASCPTGGAEC